MKKTIGLKAMALVSMLLLTNQAFTLVDSTTDNQLPSMRNVWQDREYSACQLNSGEMDLELDSNADVIGNVVNKESSNYRDKRNDIEEMQSGGNYVSDWVETNGKILNESVHSKPAVIDGYEDTIKNTDIDTIQTGGDYTNW